jgi:hypothetical protein
MFRVEERAKQETTVKQVASRNPLAPPKRRLTFNRLHGVISLKIELFITTAVRTSNPTRRILPIVCPLHIQYEGGHTFFAILYTVPQKTNISKSSFHEE